MTTGHKSKTIDSPPLKIDETGTQKIDTIQDSLVSLRFR